MTNKKPLAFDIKPIPASHWQELSTLAHHIWRQHYPSIIGKEQTEYMLAEFYNDAVLRGSFEQPAIAHWGSWRGGGLKGFMKVEDCGEHDFIHSLYIHPACHGQGMARALLNSRAPKALHLRVNKDNLNAMAFYQRYGFTVTGADTQPIGQGFVRDDYVMQRPAEAFAS